MIIRPMARMAIMKMITNKNKPRRLPGLLFYTAMV